MIISKSIKEISELITMRKRFSVFVSSTLPEFKVVERDAKELCSMDP